MKRREALGLIGAAAGATMLARATVARGEMRRVERIGLQLYTVRTLLARDVPGTLAAVAAAGYIEVETAGLAGLSPAQFAAALKQAALVTPSAHVPLPDFEAAPTQMLEIAALLGQRYLVVPIPDFRQNGKIADFQRLAERLNTLGAQCKAAQIQLAYHNHDFEFAPIGGVRPYDVLLARCDTAMVKFELDLYWATKAGADPAALLRAAPERFVMCHVKDMTRDGAMAAVGDGAIDFAALFTAGSGLKHYFVEHDEPADPLDSIRRSAVALRALRYAT